MPSSAVPPRPSTLPRLIGDASGTSAVEFGLLSIPFVALIGALMQIGFMIWAQENLDFTFQKAIRTVFTGKFQQDNANSGATSAALLTAIQNSMCGPTSGNGIATVYSCSGVKIDLKLGPNSGKNFAGMTFSSPIDPSTKTWASGFGTSYTCAPPGAIVIATAAVKFPMFVRFWGLGVASFADGGMLLQSTAVFRTEPYATSGNGPC